MSETAPAPQPHLYERIRSREAVTDQRLREVGVVAVESQVLSSEKLRKINRWKRLGEKALARSEKRADARELSEHRKVRHAQKVEGLSEALDTRKAAVKATKKEVKFAERGYGLREYRRVKRAETAKARADIVRERGGLPEGRGSLFTNRAIKLEAKARAEAAIVARETQAYKNLEASQQKLKLAKARKSQTRSALYKTKLHVSGNPTNRVSARGEIGLSQEDRLARLESRDRLSGELQRGERQAQKIYDANERLKDISPKDAEGHMPEAVRLESVPAPAPERLTSPTGSVEGVPPPPDRSIPVPPSSRAA